MLIKKADDRAGDIETLKGLAARPDVPGRVRKAIGGEIAAIAKGMKGEREAAYEIEFHYKNSMSWMILHDLRLECNGRVAQIDHLLLNRFMQCFVCESKLFARGVSINAQGQFAAISKNASRGIPSPVAQNQRHMDVLRDVITTGLVPLPKRMGMTPSLVLHNLVLVSKNAQIVREGGNTLYQGVVIKCDQLQLRVEQEINQAGLTLALKIVGAEALETFARRLAAAHTPKKHDWAAHFGLPPIPAEPAARRARPKPAAPPAGQAPPHQNKAGKSDSKQAGYWCFSCKKPVPPNVAKFCWGNRARFGGKVYCRDCQKGHL